VNFADGDNTAKVVAITAIDDAVVDGDKTVTLSLTAPTGTDLKLSPATPTITIVDNDAGSGALTCPVGSTVVSGNRPSSLTLGAGSWCVRQAQVGGTLTIGEGSQVTVLDSKIMGTTSATRPQSLRMCDSVFSGNVIVTGATGPVVIGDPAACGANQIGGNVLARDNHGGVVIRGNRVSGTVTGSGNDPVAQISGNTR
jgi:hypothetical protein